MSAAASLRNRVKPMIFAALFAVSLAIGSGADATHVGAERIAPGGDSFQQGCAALQSSAYGLVHEWYNGASDARKQQILAELHNIGLTYQQIGCEAVFGSMLVAPPGSAHTYDIVSVGGQSQVLSNPPAPGTASSPVVRGGTPSVASK